MNDHIIKRIIKKIPENNLIYSICISAEIDGLIRFTFKFKSSVTNVRFNI